MLRYVSVFCIVLLLACRQNSHPAHVGSDPMKKDFITCPDKVAEGAAAESQAGKVLLDSNRAYAAIRSYVGTVRLKSAANYERGLFRETRTLKVFCKRPGRIRLEGFDSNGDKYVILCDGRTTRVSSAALRLDGTRDTIQDAMLEFSGVSLGASEMLPSILLDIKWHRETFSLPYGPLLPAFATKAKLTSEEKIGEHHCYRIVCPREIANWTFYVDKETLLVRRLDEDTSEEQMRLQRELGGGGFTGNIQSTRCVQSFEIEQINVKLDETIFARP